MAEKKVTKKKVVKKRVSYPRIKENVITEVVIEVEPQRKWELSKLNEEEGTRVGEDEVCIMAPCNDNYVISKKDYIGLRKGLDKFFGVQ
jgi:hypothetical protein